MLDVNNNDPGSDHYVVTIYFPSNLMKYWNKEKILDILTYAIVIKRNRQYGDERLDQVVIIITAITCKNAT